MNSIFLFPISLILFLSVTLKVSGQVYRTFDAETPFTNRELYMMDNCGTDCSSVKSFEPIPNPVGVPVLSDAYAKNSKVYKLWFPGCQFSSSKNFCKKTMAEPNSQKQFSFGTDVWHAMSIFVPESFDHDSNDKDPVVLYQWHEHPDELRTCDNWRSPPLSLRLNRSGWSVNVRGNKNKCELDNCCKTYESKAPLARGEWSHFVLHVRFDWNDGFVEAWLKDSNGIKKIADFKGTVGYNDSSAPYDYVSFGYYWTNGSRQDITLYYDRILWADSRGSLNSLMYKGGGKTAKPAGVPKRTFKRR